MAPTPDLSTNDNAIVSLRVTFDPGRWFRVINVTNGLAMDGGGTVAAGSNLKIWTPDGSTNLQFRAEEVEGGYFTLTNRTNGFVIDGAGGQQGTYPVQSVYSGAASQQWSITDTGSNIFVIANRATGLVLDSGGNVGSGSPLKQWGDDGSPNLRWQFSVI